MKMKSAWCQFISHVMLNDKQKIIFKKKNIGGFAQPDFKTYFKITEIKTVRYWHKDRRE